MKHFAGLVVLLWVAAAGVYAQGTSPTTPPVKAHHRRAAAASTPSVSARLAEMKEAIDAQQQQIQQLRQDLSNKDQSLQQLQQRLDQNQAAATEAQAKAEAAATETAKQEQTVTTLSSDVSDLKLNSTNAALSLQETQKNITDALESPLALHFKGITITPGGFLAAETVYRRTGLGADINTPFNSIPYSGSSQTHLSEFFGSGRQSRISMLGEGKINRGMIRGYVEADFLSASITSNNNQSNSYSLRQRQAFAQAALNNGWTFTGGQMWSLVTETKAGEDNRSEVLPMTIDPQYHVGFSWARQYGFRVTKKFGNSFWLGAAAENAQTTVGGEGSSANFLIGSAGSSGGLYNPSATYAFNKTPDFIVKAVYQTGVMHAEVFGLLSEFRDRIFPNATAITPSASGAYNNSATGAGLGANIRASMFHKHIDAGLHFLGGQGIGRYGTTGLPDVYVRADGALGLIRSEQALGTLEYHAKKLDIYANVGGEYAQRASLSTTKGLGYGSPLQSASGCGIETVPGTATSGLFPVSTKGFLPGALGSCNVDTRSIIEGTLGFWYRFYSGPKGRLQWGPQFSYVVKNGWTGVGGNPSAYEPMVFTSFRYYLP
ncbi:MAG: hypothetical protein JOY93_06525 [Acidobacteriales bacterium]|nr:hypothetical protein [Terriglobales bacterium]